MGKSRAARLAEAKVRQAQEDPEREQEAQGLRTSSLRSRSTVADVGTSVEAHLPAGYTFESSVPKPVIQQPSARRAARSRKGSKLQKIDPDADCQPKSQYGGPQAMGGSQFNYPPQASNIPQSYIPPPSFPPVNNPRVYNPSLPQPLQPPQNLNSYPQIPNQSQLYQQLPPQTRQQTQSHLISQSTPQYYNPPPAQPLPQPQVGDFYRPQSPVKRERSVSPPSGNSKNKLPAVPSKASGGVPEPTPEYIRISRIPTPRLKIAQHLLIIIDLNGTLLHRPNRKEPTKFIKRPHTDRFLNYCINTFTVVIWSSAQPENVLHMCANIFSAEMAKKVVAIWGRDKFNLSPSDYKNKTQCFKRLTKIWEDKTIAASHPESAWGKKWDQTNTVLIDDDNYKGRSEPFNLIEIPEFAGKLESETGDILPQVHDYLNKLSLHDNVSSYLRLNPWKAQDAAEGPPGYLKTGK